MTLAVVRSLGTARRLRSAEELEDFEQELVDQFALASAAAGITDRTITEERSVLVEFLRFTGRPVWEATPAIADRFLEYQRNELGWARGDVLGQAVGDVGVLRGCEFAIARAVGADDVEGARSGSSQMAMDPVDEGVGHVGSVRAVGEVVAFTVEAV